MPSRPMLDGVALQQVQEIEADEDEVLSQHSVPALEGDFLQKLGRKATRVTLTGVLTGPAARDGLKTLRKKFKAAQVVPFVADIATATKVDKVLIEELEVRDLAGKPEHFEYSFTLLEYVPPPKTKTAPPPPPPPPPPPSVRTGTLVVEVIVEGQSGFDFRQITVSVDGTKEDGTPLTLTLTNRSNNVWTQEKTPPGHYTARAAVSDAQPMSGSADAAVRAGQTTRVTITLRAGALIAKAFVVHFRFDKAFIEPSMRAVLKQVSDYAQVHADEKLVIVGHTDLTGSAEYNQSLSERRARSVFAFLTFGTSPAAQAAALADWNSLRQRQSVAFPTINDSWGTRQYQHLLQDLGFYQGNVDGKEGAQTDAAIQAFRHAQGLLPGTIVDDAVWNALIRDYLSQDNLAVSDTLLLLNSKAGCDGGILKWLGCGEESPLPLPQPSTPNAFRPYRRVELLFVSATRLPCQVPRPDTFEKPAPGAVGSTWCLGPKKGTNHFCFATRKTEEAGPNRWYIVPVEPGTITVQGSMKLEDGKPAADVKYVLIAPDGEFMDGERPSGPQSGEGIPARTKGDGTFSYSDKPKGIGVYTLEIQEPFIARLAGAPPDAGKGNVVWQRLDDTSSFDVILRSSGQ